MRSGGKLEAYGETEGVVSNEAGPRKEESRSPLRYANRSSL